MKVDDSIDEMITQHAIFKIMDNDIIPCNCGGHRKIIQNKNPELLETECSKCGAKEPFNISDLAFVGGALLKFVLNEAGDTKIRPPKVTYEQVSKMIEDIQTHEAWTKEMQGQSFRQSLKIFDGGLSR
jgi:hypothetical protein